MKNWIPLRFMVSYCRSVLKDFPHKLFETLYMRDLSTLKIQFLIDMLGVTDAFSVSLCGPHHSPVGLSRFRMKVVAYSFHGV
jgi:hypothetical protein